MQDREEFYRKKITQTEYRGSRYSSRHEQGSQFLDTDIQPIALDSEHSDDLKKHISQQLSQFLSKVVPEDYISSVLSTGLLKKIYKLLDLK